MAETIVRVMVMPSASANTAAQVIRFGLYEADFGSGELRKRGIRIGLRDQSFRVLSALLERAGQLVTREELRQLLWHDDVFVDFENNLNAVVSHLREVLCDSAEHPRYIETLPKYGYRFIGRVTPAAVGAEQARAGRTRLLVLPFLNLSGDPAQEYFSDAMTDEIITGLASFAPEEIAVIARTTAMRYKGSRKDVSRIRRELNVDYVVEGAIRRNDEQVVLNVQLIRSSDQTHLFARKYEAELRDIFRAQKSIATDIATHIDTPAAAEIQRRITQADSRRNPTENVSAYNEYIQGRYLGERLTVPATESAKQHFEQAIRQDPLFALAHVALADLYSWVGYLGYMRPRDAYSTGIRYAIRAAELDGTLAEAHAVLAEYHKQLDFNWPAAEREMQRALELSPASPFVRLRHAVVFLMPQNRIGEAIAAIECALESDPLAGATRFWLGIMLLLAREYDRAIDEARRLLELEPVSPWPHFITGVAYRQKYFEGATDGTLPSSVRMHFADQAIAGHRKAIELSPGSHVLLGWLGLALGVCGREREARAVLEQLQECKQYILPTSFAHVHLGLGEFDVALKWFDRAVDERDQVMMPILSYAHFDVLRDDARFHAILRKMKLA